MAPIAPLTDPWFEAEFYGGTTATSYQRQGPVIQAAQGLFLWCPCGYPNDRRAHGLLIPFANPRFALPPHPDHGPQNANGGSRPRWTLAAASTGLSDLTLTPSVDVKDIVLKPDGTKVVGSCWHGFISNGEVT